MTGTPLLPQLLDEICDKHPRCFGGVQEAMGVAPERFEALARIYLGWAVAAFGLDVIPRLAAAYAGFCSDVNLAQARYEASGRYESKSFLDCLESVYSSREAMDDYLLGVYLTNFLWPHHLRIAMLFEDRFLPVLPENARLAEIAPGHGGWGLLALHRLPRATLRGFDVSPSSIAIAGAIAEAAGLSGRASYEEVDALRLDPASLGGFDGCICSFLIEHLEDPEGLMRVLGDLVTPGGKAFLTGALTAAQVDHIFEFRRESEFVLLAECHGFRVLEMVSVAPPRTLPSARFLPRSVALILQRRAHEHW